MELITITSNLSHMKSLKFIPINGNEPKTNATPANQKEISSYNTLHMPPHLGNFAGALVCRMWTENEDFSVQTDIYS